MRSALCLGVAALAGLLAAGCADDAAPPDQPKPYAESDVCDTAYIVLVKGGSLYVGTVRSADKSNVAEECNGIGNVTAEHGSLKFKVERTLYGDRQDELLIPYALTLDDPPGGGGPLPTDWGGGHLWDGKRPLKGQRLMLLFQGDENKGVPVPPGRYVEEWPLRFIWRLRADDPLVPGFEKAAQYLTEKDPDRRREVFRGLCSSRLKNIRRFAYDASFGAIDPTPGNRLREADPVTRSGLVVDFLRLAGPLMEDDERQDVTGCFSRWLGSKGEPDVTTPALREAFENWYLTELSDASSPERRACAVKSLYDIADPEGEPGRPGHNELGAADTIQWLFAKGGRGPLLGRLEACSHSADAKINQKCQELLEAFRAL